VKVCILTFCRAVAWGLAGLITLLSLVPPTLRPETGLPHNLEHFGIFGAAGLAFGVGYYADYKIVMMCLVIFAGAIELAQTLVPGRHARVSDFVVDAIGLVIACAVGVVAMKAFKSHT
jgi:VanZ family protein